MALDRTNMVSLLDIGSLMGGKTPKIVEMGDGYKEITEDWGPNTQSDQYVNMKNASNTVKGYALSMTPERDHLSDEMQTAINTMFKTFPTGEKCNTYYYRFYKTDITGTSGDCIRVPVTVCPSSTGGSGGDNLTSSIQINGNGDVEVGTITISEGGYEWAVKQTGNV
uniref:Uncharacterized protein n=1 Tax=Myoviridae sp. ctq9w2 TaxID=2825177 RepID=A0A8S5PX49_9CAUD|nr:MAG TPA: hypothetical protein [Myoviridae sp. ctq9w2]